MRLKPLLSTHKALFNRYLKLRNHELSVYAFENIYPWKGLFAIQWAEIDRHLCVFFEDAIGIFLYLPPLSSTPEKSVINRVFVFMDSRNKHKEISRIENIEAADLSWYKEKGFDCQSKFSEYLCARKALASLQGNDFKSKRAACNYFTKHYTFEYIPYESSYKEDCVRLYKHWMDQRAGSSEDPVYQGMLRDSLTCLNVLLNEGEGLQIRGSLVKIDNQVKAFTFGFPISEETFCIQFEITDLKIKGLSQFIFRQFCAELDEYTYINIMDDSGLPNLKTVKQSYHPLRLIPAYVASRENE